MTENRYLKAYKLSKDDKGLTSLNQVFFKRFSNYLYDIAPIPTESISFNNAKNSSIFCVSSKSVPVNNNSWNHNDKSLLHVGFSL